MNKPSSMGVVAFAALVVGLAVLGFSTPAQAYPDVRVDLKVNRSTLYAGQQLTAAGASSGTTCSWTIDWHDQVRRGTSSGSDRFRTTFTAPQVSAVTKIPLRGTCGSSAGATARGAAVWSRTITITVLPPSVAVSPPIAGADLPGSGGPNMLFLVGGLVLLASGATAVTVARRRAEEAETQAFRA